MSRFAGLPTRSILLVALLLLSACQTVRPPVAARGWSERRAALHALDNYEFTGRVAVTGAGPGASAGLRWQQRGRTADVGLRAPLGLGGAEVHFDERLISYRSSDGETVEGERAVSALHGLLGFDPPLASLRYWLIGADDPSQPETHVLDDQSRLASLQQGDWRIDYEGYQAQSLPQRLTLSRDALRVRIVVQEWHASLSAAGT